MSTTDLSEGLESLEYWRGRRDRLAWYRISARREAAEMTNRWERRVRTALFAQRGVPLRVRASAGLVLLAMRFRRRRSHTLPVLVSAFVLWAVVLPLVATIALLAQIF